MTSASQDRTTDPLVAILGARTRLRDEARMAGAADAAAAEAGELVSEEDLMSLIIVPASRRRRGTRHDRNMEGESR